MGICLVTGGAGFIGSHLVEALLEQGRDVRVLDDFSTGDPANLDEVSGRIDVVEADITDAATVQEAMRGVELVFHQAALASVPRSVANPMATHRACVDGTLNVLVAARDAKVRRVVYAASSSAYGNSERLPKTETDPTAPLSPYAVSKLAGEQYCAAFTEVYGVQTVRLRYFNVFGPRQTPDSPYAAVIPLFMQALAEGERPVVNGDGRQSRDFTYVGDVVRANLLAAEAAKASGKVYNVAGGRRITLLELLEELGRIMGVEPDPRFVPPRPGDVKHSQADIRRAWEDLGYRPETSIAQGLEECVAWFHERVPA